MATDLERLVVEISANVNGLTKSLAKASNDVGAFGRSADAETRRVAKAISQNLGGVKLAGIGGLDKISAGMTAVGQETYRAGAASRAGAERMRVGFAAAAAAAKATNAAAAATGRTAALSSYELRNLSFQMNDVITQLAMGQGVFRTAASQGGQIFQVFQTAQGGPVAGLKQIGSLLIGLVTPARLAAAGIAGVGALGAKAFLDYDAAIKKIQVGLIGVGRASGATVADIERISEATSKASDISVSAARDVTTALAATGKISVGNLPDVSKLARGWAALTDADLSTAGKDLAKIFSDPISGVDTLANRLGVLDDATSQYVKTLAAQGRSQDAIKVLVQAVAPEIQRAAEQTSIWSRAWDAVSSAASQASAAAGKAISDQVAGVSRAQRLAELRNDPTGRNQIYQTPEMRAARAQELAKLEEEERADNAAEQKRSESSRAAEQTRATGEIVRSYDDIGEAIRKVEADREKLGAAIAGSLSSPNERIDGGVEKAIQSYAGLTARIEVLRRQYELGGAAAASALRQADFDAKTAGLDGYAKSLAQINRQFDEMAEAAKEAGNVRALPTIERSRQAAKDAFAAENAKALTDLQKSSEASLRSVNALTLGERASAAAEEARVQAIQAGRDALYASVSAEQARARVIAEANRAARDALRDAREALELAGQKPADRARQQIEIERRRNREQLDGAGVSVKPVPNDASLRPAPGRSPNLALVDPRLLDSLTTAAKALPAGYRAVINEGYNPNGHAPGSQHHRAGSGAVDLQIIGPNGAIPNRGADTTGLYTQLARAFYQAIDKDHPELTQRAAWGGAFGTRPGGSTADLMHFDLGGERGSIASNRRAAIMAQVQNLPPVDVVGPVRPSDKIAGDKFAALDKERAAEILEQNEAIKERARALQLEKEAWGQNAQAQATALERERLLNEERRRSSAPVSAERMAQINAQAAQVGQIAGAEDQFHRLKAASDQFSDSLADGLVNVAMNGGKVQDVLKGILAQLASMALKQIFTGGGQGGGLFGSLFGGLFGGGGGLFGGAFADGGQVLGPGGPRSDSIVARVSNGEYIVNSRSARANLPLLHAINYGRMPRFADGGLVGGPMPSMPSIPMATARPGGRSAVLTNSPTINMTPAEGVTPQQLAQVLEQNNKQFARNILPIVRDADRRFG